MKVLNFGSLNLDHVYQLDEFVQPGQTVASHSYQQFYGGKGLNQSVALSRGGADTFHAGQIGEDGQCLKDYLNSQQVNTSHIITGSSATGHAMIQVNSHGENAIIISGGANQNISAEQIDATISCFSTGDLLLIQNEIAGIPTIIQSARKQGLTIAFNPAPFTPQILDYPLELIDIFFLNETELQDLAEEKDLSKAIKTIQTQYPEAAVISTQGSKGVRYIKDQQDIFISGISVKPTDTTAAGDTFIGYYLAALTENKSVETALQLANAAAALSVTRHGAADSIPTLKETLRFIELNS